jgi:hypothetical protein
MERLDQVHVATARDVIPISRDFIGLGFSAFDFMVSGPRLAEQTERLATEVIPALRRG